MSNNTQNNDGSNKKDKITDWRRYLEKSKIEYNLRLKHENDIVETITKDQFEFIKSLGKGTCGNIMVVQKKDNKKLYVAKEITTNFIKAERERRILKAISFPFIIYMAYSFRDEGTLYFILPYIDGGDLFEHLKKNKRFYEQLAKFYTAQIVLAIEYLHFIDIIYRDLKPENVLIDKQGYLKLTDFNLSKQTDRRTYTLCGTGNYIAPEVILQRGYGKSVDFWTLGVFIYELNSGNTPFYDENDVFVYEKIINVDFGNPQYFSLSLRDLIGKLLVKDPTKRIGVLQGGFQDIKRHSWFTTIDWISLVNKNLPVPMKNYRKKKVHSKVILNSEARQ